ILSGPLRWGPPPAFALRLLLAATLVPSYGMYSGYELFENEPHSDANEEYLHSEKYELKHRDWGRPDSLVPLITRLNQIRRRPPAPGELRNLLFHHSNNDRLLLYSKRRDDDVVLVIANLDPYEPQSDTPWLDLDALGLDDDQPYEVHDEITGTTFLW